MSAFIVDTETINTIVNYYAKRKTDIWNPETDSSIELTPEEIGQVLIDANFRSVNARYNENEVSEKYTYKLNIDRVEPVQIIKHVHCLEYQSCEYDRWERSLAKRICEEIISKAIRNLKGYEEAKWG